MPWPVLRTPRVWLLGALVACAACAPGREGHYRALNRALVAGNYSDARAQLARGSKDAYAGRDALLAPLDAAMVEVAAGEPKAAIDACERAKHQMEALFTKHVSEHVEAYVLGDDRLPYVGEAFERVALHLVEAAAFLAAGQPSEALVEARAMQQTLRHAVAAGHAAAASYADDAFARWLYGLLVGDDDANLGRADDAVLELTQALHLYETQDAPRFATPVPHQLAAHLGRALARAGHTDALRALRGRYPHAGAAQPEGTELVVLHLAGEVPAKLEAAWDAWIGLQVLRVPYPVFGAAQLPAGHLRARLRGDEAWHDAELASNTGAIARATLRDKAEAIHDRAVARAVATAVASNALLVGGAIEGGGPGGIMQLVGLGLGIAHDVSVHADTRSWRTLFDRVELLSLAVPDRRESLALELEVHLPGGRRLRQLRQLALTPGRINYLVVRSL